MPISKASKPFKRTFLPSCLTLAVWAFAAGSALQAHAETAVPAAPAVASKPALASGLDANTFDASVRVQDDLFKAVNGQWLKSTEIPEDKTDFGVFIQLRDRADARVKAIVEELAAKPQKPGSVEAKIGAYYSSYLNEAAIDKQGLKPLKPWLDQIKGVHSRTDLVKLMGQWQGVVRIPLAVDVDADLKNPKAIMVTLLQSGLGLPDRDYYTLDEARFKQARADYLTYATDMLRLSGDKQAAAHAADVVALETRLAQAQWTKVELRDPVKSYNPMSVADGVKAAPGLELAHYLEAAKLAGLDRLSVAQPSYLKALGEAIAEVPVGTWQHYLRLRLLTDNARVLPKPFREAHFALYSKALNGVPQQRPRWQLATAALGGALGEAVGQVYVARHFSPAHKARMQELVANLMATFGDSIDGLTWMSPATKVQAKDKLSKYIVKIGYPDVWRDYSSLEVKAGDALGNRSRAARFEYARIVAKIGKPVDRREWGMTPQTVNAYYNPAFNEIVFPAAILEAPFFDMKADDAVNYGAIGGVIGHEISHGFDDEGSQFDGDGMLRNWWTPEDRAAFDKLGGQLVAQYSAYEPVPGHHVNGKLTLGENIADLSGLQIAYKAYQRSLGGKPAPVIDGRSGDERFFFGWAQAWRGKAREKSALERLTTDPHSPSAFRANGAAVNSDAFHQTFGTKPGDGMFKPADQRIRIW